MNPSRLFNQFVEKYPEDRITRVLLKDLDFPGSMGHTAYGIYTADFGAIFGHAANDVMDKISEITGISRDEFYYKYNQVPGSQYRAWLKDLGEQWK